MSYIIERRLLRNLFNWVKEESGFTSEISIPMERDITELVGKRFQSVAAAEVSLGVRVKRWKEIIADNIAYQLRLEKKVTEVFKTLFGAEMQDPCDQATSSTATERQVLSDQVFSDQGLVNEILSYIGPCSGFALSCKKFLFVHDRFRSISGNNLVIDVNRSLWESGGMPPLVDTRPYTEEEKLEFQRAALSKVKAFWSCLLDSDKKFRSLTPDLVSIRPDLFQEVLQRAYEFNARLSHDVFSDRYLVAKILSTLGPCSALANANRVLNALHSEAMSYFGRDLINYATLDLWSAAGLPLFPGTVNPTAAQGLAIQKIALHAVRHAWGRRSFRESGLFVGLTPEIVSVRPYLFQAALQIIVTGEAELVNVFRGVLPEELHAGSRHDQFDYLAAIEIIGVEAQHIDHLPTSIDCLTALTTLNLRNNRLTELPKTILEVPCLRFLDLRENFLRLDPVFCGIVDRLRQKGCEVIVDRVTGPGSN